jgi:hypothetical protein
LNEVAQGENTPGRTAFAPAYLLSMTPTTSRGSCRLEKTGRDREFHSLRGQYKARFRQITLLFPHDTGL